MPSTDRHGPELVASRAGWPLTSTRAAGTSHWMRTQGCGLVPVPNGTWNGQPATGNVSATVTTGGPFSEHPRVGDHGELGAACVHVVALAQTWSNGPGTQVTTSAVWLTARVGPSRLIVAPWPLRDHDAGRR